MYELSDKGIDLIVSFEGLALHPYNDANGWATNGIGHLIRKGPVTADDLPITKQQAYDQFRKDAAVEITIVNRLIAASITQGQFDAMVSLVFNIGVGHFEKSPIPTLMNQNRFSEVPAAFLEHTKDAKGETLPGLVRRRNAEITLFNS